MWYYDICALRGSVLRFSDVDLELKKINLFSKEVNLLGLGFEENRESKIKLGNLVEKHN